MAGLSMLWAKALHLIFMVAWFAGLFYLPRLFVYHALCADAPGIERFKVMERKLYLAIMTPAAALTVLFGLLTLHLAGWSAYQGTAWMKLKLALVGVLLCYHLYCGKLLLDFHRDRNVRSHVWYRWFNELPAALLFAIVMLAVVRPF